MNTKFFAIVSAPLLFGPVLAPGAHAQGFGLLGKKTVTINRLLPPTVNLQGRRIRVEASADGVKAGGDELRSLLKTKLTVLIQKDPRFVLNESNPQTILKFTVTSAYIEKWTNKGLGQSNRDSYRGKIEVSYQAIDVSTHTALDSENLVETAGYEPKALPFTDVFNRSTKKIEAEGSVNECRDQLITEIVDDMAKRIAPTDEPFEARLPAGKLEPLSNLALTHRWGALEEAAEKMDKFSKPEEDSYRGYLVALAKEAQAYDLTREFNDSVSGKRSDISPKDANDDFQRAQKLLDEAGASYKEIIGENSKEKEFRPGDARTEEAIAIYAKIQRYRDENAKALGLRGAAAGRAVSKSAGAVRSPLDQVLSLCSSGIDDDSIKDYIRSTDFLQAARATRYKFNFTEDPVKLNQTCKANGAIYGRMIRQRLSGGSPGGAAAPAKTPGGASQ
jgi:hypothetical protein